MNLPEEVMMWPYIIGHLTQPVEVTEYMCLASSIHKRLSRSYLISTSLSQFGPYSIPNFPQDGDSGDLIKLCKEKYAHYIPDLSGDNRIVKLIIS